MLCTEELKKIEKRCGYLVNYLSESKFPLLDLTEISKNELFDYQFQKKYFGDEEKMAMYSVLLNCKRRRYSIGSPGFNSIFAYFYSRIIKYLHIPRLIKQRYFPGFGKQNYT